MHGSAGSAFEMKKLLLTLLQITLTIGLIVWVFHDPAKRAEMVHTLTNSDPVWFLAALATFAGILTAGMLRWMVLLRAVDIHLARWRVACIFMIGVFFNAFMLGSTGGDVVRIYYILREAPNRKTSGVVSIIVDRVIGLTALILIAVVLVVWQYQWLTSDPRAAQYVHGLLLILVAALGGLGFVSLIAWLDLAQRLPDWIPLRAKFIEVSDALRVYGRSPGALLAAFSYSIFGHLSMFAAFYLLAKGFAASIAWFSFFAIMPVIAVYTSLPITFGGLGVREKLFEDLLGRLADVPADIAILIGSSGFVLFIAWALIGGVIYLFYRSQKGAPTAVDLPLTIEPPRHG